MLATIGEERRGDTNLIKGPLRLFLWGDCACTCSSLESRGACRLGKVQGTGDKGAQHNNLRGAL